MTSLHSLGPGRVQVLKVAAHQSIQGAKSKREAWRIWNNDSADLAAKAANLSRTPDFWRLWGSLRDEWGEGKRLHQEIFRLHLAVAEMSCAAHTATTIDEIDDRPQQRQPRVFEAHYDDSRWTREISPQLFRVFPGKLPKKVFDWWTQRTQGVHAGEVRWIPFHVLYLDYQMTFGCPGPIRLGKNWVEWAMRPHLVPEKHSHAVRVRWFRQFLQMFWRSSNLDVRTATCRCDIEILPAFLPCASVPWDRGYVRCIEEWLGRTLKTHCARNAHELRCLPMARTCPRMVLDGWRPNMGC